MSSFKFFFNNLPFSNYGLPDNLKANIPVKYKFQCRLAVSNFLKEGRKNATKQQWISPANHPKVNNTIRVVSIRQTPPNNFNNLFSSSLFEFYREKSAGLCIFVIRVVRPGLIRRVCRKWSRAINIFCRKKLVMLWWDLAYEAAW